MELLVITIVGTGLLMLDLLADRFGADSRIDTRESRSTGSSLLV